jgi:hypothetical protein
MADLNALIAQGVQFQAPPDPFAQYAKLQQLQQSNQANQMNQLKMQEYQRGLKDQNALREVVSQPGFDPLNSEHQANLYAAAPTLAPGFIEKALMTKKTVADIGETGAKTAELDFKTKVAKANKAITDITSLSNPQEAAASIDTHLANGDITADKAAMLKNALNAAPSFGDWQKKMVMGILDAKDQLTTTAPKPTQMRLNDTVKTIDMNPYSPTYKQEVLPAQAIGMTANEKAMLPIHQGNLAVAQGNLKVNQAGLGIRAIAADPYNISGVQAAFPLPGAPVAGVPSPTAKQPSGAPVVQNVAAAMKAGLTGEDLLTHLPTPLANQVRAIGEGREPSPASRSLTTPAGRQLMEMVSAAYPGYDAKQYGTMSAGEKAFTSGKKGDTTRALNVAVDHLGTLQQVADALQNNDTRLFNQAGNFIALQTGNPAPTDFNAVKRIVADELTKAVIGGAGALGDRKAVDDAISAANSPAQLKSVIDRYKQLMGGQLAGMETQYTASTNKKDFKDRFLTPATKAALAAAAPAAVAAPFAAASIKVASDADYNALPSGAVFVGPDGKTRRKP